jgi:hypothetical protein
MHPSASCRCPKHDTLIHPCTKTTNTRAGRVRIASPRGNPLHHHLPSPSSLRKTPCTGQIFVGRARRFHLSAQPQCYRGRGGSVYAVQGVAWRLCDSDISVQTLFAGSDHVHVLDRPAWGECACLIAVVYKCLLVGFVSCVRTKSAAV